MIFGVYLDPEDAEKRVFTIRLLVANLDNNTKTIIAGDLNFCFAEVERLKESGNVGGTICKKSRDEWERVLGKEIMIMKEVKKMVV